MTKSNPQQVFNLQLAPAYTFATFYDEKVKSLTTSLQQLVSYDAKELQFYIWGSDGVGKTHLLQAICHLFNDNNLRAIYIPLNEVMDKDSSLVSGLDSMDLVCLDNIDCVSGKPDWEQALFNLINQLRARKIPIVLSANSSPANNIFDLADLNSRLGWGQVYQLPGLLEGELDEALCLHAKARGIEVPKVVRNYLFKHVRRDASTLVEILEILDYASLQEQRKITLPFLKQVLTTP